MSYILEALKKSEQERELGRVPGLVTAQDVEPLRRRPRWLWPVTAMLLLVNGLLLVVLLLRDDDSTPVVPLATTRTPAVALAPVPDEAETPAAPSRQELESEAVAPPHPETATMTDGISSGDSPVTVTTEPEPEPEPEPVTKPGTVIFAERPLDEPENTAVANEETEPPPESGSSVEEELPLWRELPSNVRANLPEIALDVHVYAQDPAERFVLISLQRYREGDTLEEGPRLEAITPDGVVLSSRGRRFRINKQ